MSLSNNKTRIFELLNLCKKNQGEYLPSHHGSGSWATTYSNEFVDSASEILFIIIKSGASSPLTLLSILFRKHEIKSCRSSVMDLERVKYLYNSHLRHKVEELKLNEDVKVTKKKIGCNYCNKSVADLTHHISSAHPEKWVEYSKRPGVLENLKGKLRCSGCGSFLKKLEGHKAKCSMVISN